MTNIIDRQTVIFSINFSNAALIASSQINSAINLRFAADELVIKSIVYNDPTGTDTPDVIQIWCNLTNDNLIGAFPNGAGLLGAGSPIFLVPNTYFRLNNTFQTGNINLQFQQTDNTIASPLFYNPQPLLSVTAQTTFGTVSITIEFLKYAK